MCCFLKRVWPLRRSHGYTAANLYRAISHSSFVLCMLLCIIVKKNRNQSQQAETNEDGQKSQSANIWVCINVISWNEPMSFKEMGGQSEWPVNLILLSSMYIYYFFCQWKVDVIQLGCGIKLTALLVGVCWYNYSLSTLLLECFPGIVINNRPYSG